MAALAHPTVVIIPGAFHIPSHFSSLCAQLEKAGYPTASIQLPSVDPPTPAAAAVGTPYNDALFIREKLLLPLIEGEGKDVVLLMHSYGGSPGNGSAVGLSKKGRERDEKKGGVVGLVFVSAYVAKEGQNIREDFFTPGDAKRFEKSSTGLAIDADKGTMTIIDPIPFFYSLLTESVAAHAASLLKPQAIIAMQAPSPRPAWQELEYDASGSHPCRRAFIRCLRDESICLELQDKMLKDSEVNWVLRYLDSDHSPWLSREAELVAVLKDVINGFVNGRGQEA